MPSAATTLGLPSTALVNRTMPKKAFYEHLEVSAKIKEQFVHAIERIELIGCLKESSIHIPAGEKVAEIDVLGIYLKEERSAVVPEAAIDLIARSIPNKLFFVCFNRDNSKFLIRRDKLYEAQWMPQGEVHLELTGSTLDEIWGSLCSQVVFNDADPADFDERLRRSNELASLRGQLEKLQKKRRAEKQIGRRNALWDEIKSIENSIIELEAR